MGGIDIKRRWILLLSLFIFFITASLFTLYYAGTLIIEKKMRDSAERMEEQFDVKVSWAEVKYNPPIEIEVSNCRIEHNVFDTRISRSRIRFNPLRIFGLHDSESFIRKVLVERIKIAGVEIADAESVTAGRKSPGKSDTPKETEIKDGPPEFESRKPGYVQNGTGTPEGGSKSRRRTPIMVRPPRVPHQRIIEAVKTAALSSYLPEEIIFEEGILFVGEGTTILPPPFSLQFIERHENKSLEVNTDGCIEAAIEINYGGNSRALSNNSTGPSHSAAPNKPADSSKLAALGEQAGDAKVHTEDHILQGHIQLADIVRDDIVRFFPRLEDNITSGTFLLEADFYVPQKKHMEFSGSLTVEKLEIAHPLISTKALGDIDFSYRFSFSYDEEAPLPPPKVLGKNTPTNPSMVAAKQEFSETESDVLHGELRFSKGELEIEEVELDFRPALRGLYARSEEIPPGLSPRIELSIHLPQTEVEKTLGALPNELIGPFEGIEVTGSTAWDFFLEIPLDRISDMNWISETKMKDFRVEKIPAPLNVFRLNEEFCYTPTSSSEHNLLPLRIPATEPVSLKWMRSHTQLPEGLLRKLQDLRQLHKNKETLPEAPIPIDTEYSESSFGRCSEGEIDPNYRYIPLEKMAPHLPFAVLTAEDGDFFYHGGINWHTLRYAIERNLTAEQIESGGSTITMQLIKNLFLTDTQTLRRKLHEAAFVFLIEHYARVPKTRILEIYLNIADFGPGIRGVDEACRYYFDTAPSEVDPLESVWLASILPSPRRYHRYFEGGETSKGWRTRMRSYLELMHERERLSDESYRRAIQRERLFRD